ncbi:uncharacterized protein LOC128985918 [Macrosteles quadrilineatus]|uniref:uncharacterized protein LOC128985918 n=1 Tax=Macrosteles quadrilineatus TaxID=74068 RepID=UPI0023E16059|nr:uncharacterized protein LOC128985918 [Macrosteles quadrilineatus]
MPVKLADLGLCSADDAILWQAADFVSQVELSPEMYQSLEEVKSDIENLFHPVIPYCQAIVFGSCGSTLAFKNSDVDLFLQKDGEPLKNFVRKEGRLMYRSRHFRNIVYIPSARIPIIKFQHVKTGWQGDLTASSQLGVCNTRLIRFLVSLDHRIKPLVMIIKYWAKVCGITDSGAHREFTTYSLVMLVIFYLQQLDEPLLPTIARLQQMCQHKQYSLGWECSFCDEEWSVQSQCLPPNNMSLRQLLTGFFKFYYNFDLDNVICPLLGRSVHVKDFETEDGSELPEEMVLYKERLKSDPKCKFKTDTTFRVQDPFELCLNITRNVVDKTCSVFKEACKVSLELCEQQADDALLEGLFSIDKDSLDLGDDLSINITCGEMSFDGSQTSDSAFTEWCQMTKQSIMLVLEHIYKLDVNLQKEKVFKKVKKLESSQDVHNLDSTHEDSQIFECCCKVDVWQRRKKKEKSLNRMDFNLNSFEREVCISNTLFHPNDNKPFFFTINLSVLKSAKSKGIKMNVHVKRTQHKLIKGFMNSMRYDFKIFVSQAQDFVVSVKKSSPLDGKDSLKGLLQLKLEKLPDIKDLMMKESIKRNAAKIAMEKEKRSTTQKHCEKSCETVSKPSPNDEQQTVNQVASHENLPTQETQKLINNFFKPTNHEGSCKSLNHSEVGKFNKLLNSIQKNETQSTFTSKNTNAFLASIEKVALNSSEMLSNSETDQTKNLSGEKKSCNLEQQGNSKKIEENIEDQALVVKKVEEKIDALLQMHRALLDNKQDQDNQNPTEKRTVSEINDPVQSGCPKIIEKLPSASVETVEAKNESDHKINQSIDPKTVIERPKIYSERPKKQWKPNKTCGNEKAPQEPRLWVGGGPPNCLPYHSQSQPQAAATNKPSSSTKSHCSIQNQKKWYPSLHKDIN